MPRTVARVEVFAEALALDERQRLPTQAHGEVVDARTREVRRRPASSRAPRPDRASTARGRTCPPPGRSTSGRRTAPSRIQRSTDRRSSAHAARRTLPTPPRAPRCQRAERPRACGRRRRGTSRRHRPTALRARRATERRAASSGAGSSPSSGAITARSSAARAAIAVNATSSTANGLAADLVLGVPARGAQRGDDAQVAAVVRGRSGAARPTTVRHVTAVEVRGGRLGACGRGSSHTASCPSPTPRDARRRSPVRARTRPRRSMRATTPARPMRRQLAVGPVAVRIGGVEPCRRARDGSGGCVIPVVVGARRRGAPRSPRRRVRGSSRHTACQKTMWGTMPARPLRRQQPPHLRPRLVPVAPPPPTRARWGRSPSTTGTGTGPPPGPCSASLVALEDGECTRPEVDGIAPPRLVTR